MYTMKSKSRYFSLSFSNDSIINEINKQKKYLFINLNEKGSTMRITKSCHTAITERTFSRTFLTLRGSPSLLQGAAFCLSLAFDKGNSCSPESNLGMRYKALESERRRGGRITHTVGGEDCSLNYTLQCCPADKFSGCENDGISCRLYATEGS